MGRSPDGQSDLDRVITLQAKYGEHVLMNNYRTIGILSLTFLAGILVVTAGVLWVSRDDRPPIQVVPPPIMEPGNGEPGSAGTPGDTLGDNPGDANAPSVLQALNDLKIYVHGAVVSPGVYTLQEGDRLADAVDAAGGAPSGADLSAVNLALRVADERYYYIPEVGELPPPAASPLNGTEGSKFTNGQSSSGPPSDEPAAGLINLNTAPISSLVSLPGIGDVKAQSIINYREQNGPFESVSDIVLVTGIGKTTYENLRDLVTVGVP